MTAPTRACPLPQPSSTSLRMVLVAVALVVSGLFVGTGLFNALGDSWTAAVVSCFSTDPLDIEAQLSCQAPAEQGRAAAAIGAALVVALLACVVVAVIPGAQRRRKRLTEADQRFSRAAQAVAQLAAEDRMRAPSVLVGPVAMAEPFCLGRPGDYRIALPRKLALLGDRALFEALVRHELAHLAHHDVALSWLACSLWYVLAPLLVLPLLVTFARGDPILALDILWRSALLLAVVLLVVRALLRAREYDADLRAARAPRVREVLTSRLSHDVDRKGRWQAALAWHPPAASRRAVLADPASAAALSWVDGLTLGFLVALALPIVTGIASAALLGVRAAGLASLVGALVVGPLFGAAVGLGLWRHALVTAPTGRSCTGPVAWGVLVGGVLGDVASLAGVGLGAPEPPVAVPLALAGTTALVGGLGELWLRGRTREQGRIGPPAVGFGAVSAAALLWAAQEAQLAVGQSGWVLLTTWLTTPGTLLFPGIAAVVLAAGAGWAVRPVRPDPSPAWFGPPPAVVAERLGRAAVAVGLCAGIGGALGLVAYRLVTGPPADDADALERFSAVVLGIALSGAIAVALLSLARGVRGIGAGLLSGPLATLTAGVLYLAFNAALGGNPLALLWPLFGAAVPTGLLASAVTALVGLVRIPPFRSTGIVAAIAAAACAFTTVVVTAERAVLVPGLPAVLAGVTPGQPIDPHRPDLQPAIPRDQYLDVVARPLLDGRVAEANALNAFKAARPTGAEAAARIRSDVLPLADNLLHIAQAFRFDDPVVQAVHAHALAGAKAHIDGFTLLASALDAGDRARFDQANRLLAKGNAEWESWAAAAQTL